MFNDTIVFLVVVVSILVPVFIYSRYSAGPRNASSNKYFDLSYSFDNDTIYFPGQRQYELRKDYANVSSNGFM